MLKHLPSRLQGYSHWLPESWSILVLIDRDDDDCRVLKEKLEHQAAAAGFLTKASANPGQRFKVTNRIVVEELEAWYFGDWQAVKALIPECRHQFRGRPGIVTQMIFRVEPGRRWNGY